MIDRETTGMLVCSAEWDGHKSFKMIPLTSHCPYNEMIYDPVNKLLAIISKDKKRTPQLMNKDDITAAKELHVFDMYYEYYIEEPEDIQTVVNRFAINPVKAQTILNR